MKTRNIYITLLLAVFCTAPMSAREFEQGEKIYVNVDQCFLDCNGDGGSTKYYIKHPWGGGSWTWKEMTQCGNDYTYKGTWGENGVNINTSANDGGSSWYDNINGTKGIPKGENVMFAFTPKGDGDVNGNVSVNFNWKCNSAKLFLYIWKESDGSQSNEKWVTLTSEDGNIYSGEIPSGDYNRLIVVRKSSSGTENNWNNVWCQTGDMTFPDYDRNYIHKFWVSGTSADWLTFTPSAAKIAAEVTALRSAGKEETIAICPSALGGPFSLRVKLNSAKTAYDYDIVQCHGWFISANGTSWTSVDDYAGKTRNGEMDKDILKNNLPASGPVYYYLHSAKAAGRRLIKVTTDGAKDCDLDCTITSFEVVCSAVNANDTTYTLDGVVAFGEPNGKLVITCEGIDGNKDKSVTISSAKSPQVFSITGLRAATTNGKTTTVTAKFTGNSDCTKQTTFNVPNAVEGISTTPIDVLVGQTATLKPKNADYSFEHEWYVNGKKVDTKNDLITTPCNEEHTDRYLYQEFNPPVGDMSDLMSNGGYEATDADYGTKWQKSLISDYEFWGKYETTSQINFYTDTVGAGCINPNKRSDNGFAVVKNANNFFYTYAKIKAREGSWFALFDAASDGIKGKKAWYTNTQKSPKLKLQKGTTYLFSFWAANINNYGEMDNAAELQFQIEYKVNGTTVTKELGEVLDLGSAKFRNNRWHQCSATFTATADADNVTISVVNKNTNKLNTGNDFALDDIQFRPISNNATVVRVQQIFVVKTHEPHVFALTAQAQPMACDKEGYDVILKVQYDNPMGKLIIRDKTANKVLFSDKVPTEGADWDKKKTKQVTIHMDALEPAEHEYEAYFEQWTKSKATAKSQAPEFVVCCTEGIMYSKWDNVLFINNHDSLYVAFQWYKNGAPMSGETKQRYYTGATPMAGTTDTYYCAVTRRDGTIEKSCEKTFDECPRSVDHTAVEDILLDGVAVYPTQVAAGDQVTVTKTFAGSMQVSVLTLTGQTVSTTLLQSGEAAIVMPNIAGLYLLQLHTSTSQRTVKINVY